MEVWLNFGLTFIMAFGALFVTLPLFLFLANDYYKRNHGRPTPYQARNNITKLTMLVSIVGAVSLVPVVGFDLNKISVEDYADNKIDKLTIEIEGINNALENIDGLSISEIKSELDKSLKYVKEIKEEAIIQQESINKLRLELAEQKEEADKSIKQANDLKNLSEDELMAIESLITANAVIENKKSFQRGVILSFPIGVLASLFATWIVMYLGRRRTNSETIPESTTE
ncbi:MAG: hypothetical protein AAF502_16180 [Bacteroidota bacterium]